MRLPVHIALSLLLSWTTMLSAQEQHYRLWLTDKGESPYSTERPEEYLSERAISHRHKYNIPIDSTDWPIAPSRLAEISARGARILATSKWLNTATVALPDSTWLPLLTSLPFVKRYDWLGAPIQPGHSLKKRQKQVEPDTESLYGEASLQIALHNGDKLHRAGFSGDGMMIAVIDGGFQNADRNSAFDQSRIVGNHDFIDPSMDFKAGDPHGSSVLSTMLVNDSSSFIGTAPQASYWLLRSEDTSAEYPTEEDYWVAALEYADSLGVDVITSSLGYTQFDDTRFDHSWEQLDGKSAFISQGAALGVQKGLLIIVSAGNEGGGSWERITVPGDVDGLLTVGAVSSDSKPAYFSGRGYTADNRIKPDIAALGYPAATIDPEGTLQSSVGTSFATPIIAGLTACLWQALPHLSAQEIIALIRQNSSQYLSPDSLVGYGIPDFYAAYRQGAAVESIPQEQSPLCLSLDEGIPFVSIAGLPVGESTVDLDIYDTTGKIIARYTLPQGVRQSLCALPKGIYLLVARSKSHCWTLKLQRP